MSLGILYLLCALLVIVNAMIWTSFTYLFYWLALNFVLVSYTYFKNNMYLFGKKNGKIFWGTMILFFPYFLCLYSLWYLRISFSKENCYDQIDDLIFIGRRPKNKNELPLEVEVVIDLTCEFSESKSIREHYEYEFFPILDGAIPDIEKLEIFLEKVAYGHKKIYIHCAQGHGRTCLFTCLLLIKQGKADGLKSALDIIHQKRPDAKMRDVQQRFCIEYQKNKLPIANLESK